MLIRKDSMSRDCIFIPTQPSLNKVAHPCNHCVYLMLPQSLAAFRGSFLASILLLSALVLGVNERQSFD